MSTKAQSIRVVRAPASTRWLQVIGLLLAAAVVVALGLAFRPSPGSSGSGNTSPTMTQVGGDSTFQYKLLP